MRLAPALLGLASCGHPAAAPTPVERTPVEQLFSDDPVAVWGGLEERLLAARDVHVEARARFAAPAPTDLHVWLDARRDGESTLTVEGTLAGSAVHGRWRSSQPATPDHRDVQPETWAESLVLGLTRMGVMHDAALVVLGGDPETGHGDLGTWVTVDDLAWQLDDPETGTLTFSVSVDGAAATPAQITFDDEGLPLRRVSSGTTESYPRFIVK